MSEAPQFRTADIERPDGASVHLHFCQSQASAKGIVHINHGMCEHSARYERFMKLLARHGYHSVAQDHRGHGLTTAPGAALGMFAKRNGWEKVVGDALAVNNWCRDQFGDLPIIVFGHSMGATVALDYALSHPQTISAAAIWNGAMSGFLPKTLTGLLKLERALKGSDVASGWARSLTFDAWNREFKPNRTAFDWLSRDDHEVDLYVADPACGFDATIGMWLDLLGGLSATADPARYRKLDRAMPFHLLNGACDPCSNKGGSAKQLQSRLERAGFADVTKIVLENTRHEALNETNRDETMKAFIDWLDTRFSVSPSR